MSPWYEMRGKMNVLVLRWFLANSALIPRGCLRCACACVSLAWSLAKNRPEPAISVVPDVTFFAAFTSRNHVTQPRHATTLLPDHQVFNFARKCICRYNSTWYRFVMVSHAPTRLRFSSLADPRHDHAVHLYGFDRGDDRSDSHAARGRRTRWLRVLQLGVFGVSARAGRDHADLRKALGYVRPQAGADGGHRRVSGRLAAVRLRLVDAAADRVPRIAGIRRG